MIAPRLPNTAPDHHRVAIHRLEQLPVVAVSHLHRTFALESGTHAGVLLATGDDLDVGSFAHPAVRVPHVAVTEPEEGDAGFHTTEYTLAGGRSSFESYIGAVQKTSIEPDRGWLIRHDPPGG